ncbi:hypothetical protein SAMN04488503_2603 [Humidesulfovibrio mexicanus]|uniref:Uncharacterized protein n=1 Tax=Humidesulfovibrio mexicanus TaxID=147047 RepID=A0A239BHN3_9BACT|nr:hypothetical protein [Humidesulfovibrio mexicanus]SNS07687.1 hypothetical protein SAMN04488503_2603 [Humidesulfovibrio mexicanus]
MEIYALFDENGHPKGFYTPVVHSRIPGDAIRISVSHWHEFIRNKGLRRWDGEKPVKYDPPQSAQHRSQSPTKGSLHPIALVRNTLAAILR